MDEGMPDLFSKVGPLPAWAWGAIVVGGYILYSHHHAAAALPVSDGGTNVDPLAQDPSVIDDGSSNPLLVPQTSQDAAYNYQDVLGGSYTGTTGQTTFASNQAWGVYSISFLIREGEPPSTVTTAITHYLAGTALTTAEQTIISRALTDVGPPPLPLPVMTAATPATGALTAPVAHITCTTTHHPVVTWTKVAGAVAYRVMKGGTVVGFRYATGPFSYTGPAQKVGTTAGPYMVQAIGSKSSPFSAPVSVRIT